MHEHTAGHIHVTPGQGKGVNQLIVEHCKGKYQGRTTALLSDPLANLADIGLQLRIAIDAKLTEDLLVLFRTQLNFRFFRQGLHRVTGKHANKNQEQTKAALQ